MGKKEMDKIFLALDNMTREEVFSFLDEHGKNIKLIKIGMELFYKYGPTLLREVKEKYNVSIFLDLKLHDIPNTVSSAIKSLKDLDIDFLTVHISGGQSMLEASRKSCSEHLPKTKLIGVSILTSIDEQECLSVYNQSLSDTFKTFLRSAIKAKLDGIVCSPHELAFISKDDKIFTICPGIRTEVSTKDDQKRVTTPKEAFQKGANYLVMGRALRHKPELITYLNKEQL